jgi:hypothetical protein
MPIRVTGSPAEAEHVRSRPTKEGIVTRATTIVSLIMAAGLFGTQPVVSQSTTEKLEITAWAVNMSNIDTGENFRVDFTVDRWSTPEERQNLIVTVLENGPDALLRALQKMPSHGRLRVPTLEGPDPMQLRLGWDLRYAWQEKGGDGRRRVVLATDRFIPWWEAANRPRTVDYPFTVIEIRTDAEGRGEGKMSIATKVNFDRKKNVIELETYASEPLRLQNVLLKPKRAS